MQWQEGSNLVTLAVACHGGMITITQTATTIDRSTDAVMASNTTIVNMPAIRMEEFIDSMKKVVSK